MAKKKKIPKSTKHPLRTNLIEKQQKRLNGISLVGNQRFAEYPIKMLILSFSSVSAQTQQVNLCPQI